MSKDEETVKAITDHIERHGVPPTMRELGKALGLTSSSSVHRRVQSAVKAGLIEQVGDRKWLLVRP